MPPFLNFIEKPTSVKGLNPDSKIITTNLPNHLLSEEIFHLELLKSMPRLSLEGDKPVLAYPGCGSDILYPLSFIKNLTNIRQIELIFIDKNDHWGMIKSILDDLGVSFIESNEQIKFYWDGLFVELEFHEDDIFNFDYPPFDIYFERKIAFFKDQVDDYEQKMYDKLKANGLIISDYGFKNVHLQRISVPHELSAYGEMIVGRKIT